MRSFDNNPLRSFDNMYTSTNMLNQSSETPSDFIKDDVGVKVVSVSGGTDRGPRFV